jgi:hypothetical protein
MNARLKSIRFNKVRRGFGIVCVAFLAIAGGGAAYATPFTSIDGDISISGAPRIVEKVFTASGHGPILDFRSVGASFSGGKHADASAAAFADFGSLGVAVDGDGITPAISRLGVSSFAETEASFDDTLTPIAPFLPGGAPVKANLLLNLDFSNLDQTLNASVFTMNYELTAKIIQGLGSHPVTTTFVDDCFSIAGAGLSFCNFHSHMFVMPRNTGPGGVILPLAPIKLSLAIGQPFRLIVSLTGVGQADSPVSAGMLGAYNFSGDALDTSEAFLQPLQDFTLVSESGHDYSPPAGGGSVPEPATLGLLGVALMGFAALRRRSV